MTRPDFWEDVAGDYPSIPESLLRLALNRLRNGDVKDTAYGVRVALREDLGDNRSASGATAYWPERRCMCRHRHEVNCSHRVAAKLFRAVQAWKGWELKSEPPEEEDDD